MKKWLWLVGLGLIFLSINKLEANQDSYGNQYVNEAVWRTSNTCVAQNNLSITTQTVDFGGVLITSPSLSGMGSGIGVFDASNNLIISTISPLTQTVTPIGWPGVHVSSAGLKINIVGSNPPCISTYWQYRRTRDAGVQ